MALEELTVWLTIKDKVETTVCLIKVELNSMGFTKDSSVETTRALP